MNFNQVGELIAASNYLPNGYLNKTEEASIFFKEKDGLLGHFTKDYVHMNEKGFLFFVDRDADIIKYKGYRISSSEIETVLQNHPAVKEACVIGISNPEVGELIKAIVIFKEGIRGISSSELIKWCRERPAPYKIPNYIEFRDMLPKSKIRKLLKWEIREEKNRRWVKNKYSIKKVKIFCVFYGRGNFLK